MDELTIKSIQELEHKLLTKNARADVNFLDSVLAEDFIECGASGSIITRSEVLNNLPTETLDIEFIASDLKTRSLSEGVYINTFKFIKKSSTSEVKSFRSSIWVKTVDGWKMTYHQGTLL